MSTLAGSVRARVPRGAVVGAAVAVGLVVAAMVGGPPGRDGPPLDPRSDAPLGTSALVALLDGLGSRVDLSVGLPGASNDVALLLDDHLDDHQADAVQAWVQAGGTLVVVDPASRFSPPVADRGSAIGPGTLEPGPCSIDALDGVGEIDGGAAVHFTVGPGARSCFGNERGAFVAVTDVGGGLVAAVGGAAFLTNDLLGHVDNAVLAATLLAPRPNTSVRFVEPPIPAGGGDKTLGQLVPGRVKRALLQLGVAFVLYGLWRAIRLGRPVPETQPVAVAGSELVTAVGRLMSRTRSPGAAAEGLRRSARSALRARLGVPAEAPAATLAEIAEARTGLPPEIALAAVDERAVTTDAQLVAVARAAAAVHQEVPR